jgi:esterase/lipase superfamily enzyme
LGRFPATPFPFVRVQNQIQDDPEAVRSFQEAEQQFRAELKRRFALTPKKDVYIYVHGYNNRFADGADTLAELWHFMGREGVPLLYSWPAGRGGFTGYGYDRESGQFTVFHFKQLLRSLASFSEVENVHILAHSRGTDVVTTALRELFIETRAAGEEPLERYRIANLVLAAPDLDMEVLSQQIIAERVGTGVGQLTIYTSKGDKAIDLAEGLFGSVLRLGRVTDDTVPPEAVPLLREATHLSFVELQGKPSLIGHNYFYTNPASSSDLILVLRYQRQPGAENGRPLRPLGVQIGG